MVVSNVHHHSNYTVVTQATTSTPVHGTPPEGTGASYEIIPSYGIYIACIEFSLITPIIFGNVLIIVSVLKFRRLQVSDHYVPQVSWIVFCSGVFAQISCSPKVKQVSKTLENFELYPKDACIFFHAGCRYNT